MDKSKKIKIALVINAVLLVAGIGFIIAAVVLINSVNSKAVAKNWAGDSDIDFSQISVFVPTAESLTITDINTFRTSISTAVEEQMDASDLTPFVDAFSCEDNIKVSSDKNSATVEVVAVGGNFFDFHPMNLLYGNYFEDSDDDLYKVMLDEELAWLLFGSSDVHGMEISINGIPFYVAGVISRDDDSISEKTYTGSMYLFMNYRTYANMLTGRTVSDDPAYTDAEYTENDPTITNYEIVLVNPVKNFAVNLVTEKFPVSGCDIVDNTNRFSLPKLVAIMKDFSSGVIASNGVAYPYWENSARYVANKAAYMLLTAFHLIALPVITILILSVRGIKLTHEKIQNSELPSVKDKVSEAIRVQERKRWEKNNPGKF